ncbi:M56 family metallopeptidase [Desulfoscipio gibsoniae]|uniref:Antirepressor regulating drug resistance protein n=1 Tax=Desulfoscipio gibsoniae DSM 7213 TaxID=767817 RepID=R4KGH5_9FIRM|nr:M56 family metallopeptidase [Desulfoscipio gibsoniae]AGL00762.1 antirepressor regulating drug resistance protein [Desulfoscipio gibsoniae DSM 7213]
MIENILRLLLQITLTSSLLIAVLLVLRMVFRGKLRPTWQYAAWILVLIRLLIPLNISSPFSVMNIIQPPPITTVETHGSDLQTFSSPFIEPLTYSEPQSNTAVQVRTEKNTSYIEKIDLFQMLFILWVIGALAVFVYMLILNRVFQRRLRQSAIELSFDQIPFYRDLCRQVGIKTPLPVVISHHLTSPCLVGLFRSYIAITPEAKTDRTILRHVLLHELCHFKQKDNLFSLLRNICCIIYWFNPLVWMAALASRDDSELSCDDRVLRYLDEKESLEYGHTLLILFNACHKKVAILNTATAMANGKSRIKTRISMIINRPKTLKTISVLAAGLVILLGVMTLTSAKADDQQNQGATIQVVGDGGLTLSDKAGASPMLNEAGGQRTLDIESLRLLANGELTFSDIINGYKADEVVKDETYQYTAWRYTLDNGLRFDLQYIQEKNLPARYTASLSHSGSNYIFFPCRPESLEQFLTACAQGDQYSLKAYASFDAKKVAEIEYDETKQAAASLRVFDEGRIYTLDESGLFGGHLAYHRFSPR